MEYAGFAIYVSPSTGSELTADVSLISTSRCVPVPFVQLSLKPVDVIFVNETAVADEVGSVAKTRPETVTCFVTAPVVVCNIFPMKLPAGADALRRAFRVSGCPVKIPALFVKVKKSAYSPLLTEISKFAGAVIVAAEVKLTPLIVYVSVPIDDVPCTVETLGKVFLDTVKVGTPEGSISKSTALDSKLPLFTVTGKIRGN